ncbi:MAG: hypothetical protein O7C75_01650, partial [Verrucomicrobia bacterium]|nr:hypothetical protein [Verrucomicrobiota bacterium]
MAWPKMSAESLRRKENDWLEVNLWRAVSNSDTPMLAAGNNIFKGIGFIGPASREKSIGWNLPRIGKTGLNTRQRLK